MTQVRGSDQQLWVRRLVEAHQTPLIRYARSFVHDEHLARDLVQDVFLKLCTQSPDDLAGHEAAWLYRVCHNLAINHHRKDRRMTTSSDTVGELAPDRGHDPSQQLSAAEDQQQLSTLIADLPENQQQVIRLKFHAGLKYREISQATGLSEGNVGFLLHTALQKLRKKMQVLGISAP
jgi:RNA polymerase sigma-70 factor (ECF subfamily)